MDIIVIDFMSIFLEHVAKFVAIAITVFLEVLPYRKLKLIDEDLLESIKVVLLIEDKHGLLVVNRVN